jgi:hypothetical protein
MLSTLLLGLTLATAPQARSAQPLPYPTPRDTVGTEGVPADARAHPSPVAPIATTRAAAGALLTQGGDITDGAGHKINVTQGLTGAVLIAGKQILFRLYPPGGADLASVKRVTYHIRSDSGQVAMITLSGSMLIRESAAGGPSIGVLLPGTEFPISGHYTIEFTASTAGGASTVFHSGPIDLRFLPSKDIRFHVGLVTHPTFFNADQTWYADLEKSFRRLNSMMPVRDGVGALNSDRWSGVRYKVTECNGWVNFADCAFGGTRAINVDPGDKIDVTIPYRPGLYDTDPPGDPGPGGNSRRPDPPYSDLRRAACVSGNWLGTEMTAACFAQEIGHNFGLEPPASPHFQDTADPGHSKDPKINDPLNFDFVNRVTRVDRADRFLGDTLNNLAGGAFQGIDWISYNAFDWNFLQQQFAALPGTGSDTDPHSTLCTPNDPCARRCSGTAINSCGETVSCSRACPTDQECRGGTCPPLPCPLDPPICCKRPWLPQCAPGAASKATVPPL